ncbi:2-octaprenylphenol hydroxylase [Sinobacterium caligoides]|uniref:2-octaprenylphenol hydroxylase n=1 Tax=Sinobacterium caligoides TaxID=933926 RepID=A0A3N2DGD5_9GAMM|nr:UbiH/UbiF/VisC/COQ6 family ubiquinone biosynthesis hydroxylase [Sinobacterium caligoides]ROR98855.1 2-octaprenylphenol hydroxylase [Sinobacterium caligoides]
MRNISGSGNDYDVIIVGGGLAGSSLAAALANSPLSVAMIEQVEGDYTMPEAEPGIDHYDPRVSALTAKSQRFLMTLGAWDGIEAARLASYRQMRVWDGEGTASLEFSAAEVGCSQLGHIVENRVTVAALMQRVMAARNIEIIAPAKVTQLHPLEEADAAAGEACWALELADGRNLSAALVVAADGAVSPLRAQAGLQTREWDYHHHGLVCSVQTEQVHRATAWQRFTDEGVLAFLPLAGDDQHYCSIVWSVPAERAAALLALSDVEFCTELERQFESTLGAITSVSKRFSFPLRQRHAKEYYRDGLVLVADAAHTIHPLAGQGINLGLKDTEVLAEELLRAQKRGVGLGSRATLSRYQRRRMADNLRMMALMEALKRLFARRELSVRWLRNSGMRLVSRISLVKRLLIKEAMEG